MTSRWTAASEGRPLPDRFVVAAEYAPAVAGRHVLVVDDTWVSGGKAQSAALALKAAGAASVTILCVARWLSWQWSEHKQLIESPVVLTTQYGAR